jgi:diguanylate cyclase (GGDEF)-like protein
MELKSYLQVLIQKWRLFLIAFSVTIAATLVFSYVQPTIYRAQNTFVLWPKASLIRENDDFLRALDTLSNREEINATIAQVASSSSLKSRAADQLNLTREQTEKLTVESRVIGGTNILEITVLGPNPSLTHSFLNVISVETSRYQNGIYGVFQMEILDSSAVPTEPFRPNIPLNLLVGVALGLILAAGLAFLSHYLESAETRVPAFDILDHQTSTFNRAYFLLRLQQEISRAQHAQSPLSLVAVNLREEGNKRKAGWFQNDLLLRTASLLKENLREEDILARIDEDTFAVLIPDLDQKQIQALVKTFQDRLAQVKLQSPFQQGKQKVNGEVKLLKVFPKQDADPEDLLQEVSRAFHPQPVS